MDTSFGRVTVMVSPGPNAASLSFSSDQSARRPNGTRSLSRPVLILRPINYARRPDFAGDIPSSSCSAANCFAASFRFSVADL